MLIQWGENTHKTYVLSACVSLMRDAKNIGVDDCKVKLEEISLYVQKLTPSTTCHLAIIEAMKITTSSIVTEQTLFAGASSNEPITTGTSVLMETKYRSPGLFFSPLLTGL